MSNNDFVVWLSDIELDSPELANSKVKHLAKLTQAKFPVLPGFIITTHAYFDFLKENNLDYRIKQLLETAAIDRADSIMQIEHHSKKLFDQAKLSEKFIKRLTHFYQQLNGDKIILSLHEKSPQKRKHATLLANTKDEFVKQVKNAWAEMFASSALWHRNNHHLDYIQTGAEIIVQQKIHANKSGLVLTIDPKTHAKDKIVIIVKEPHEIDTYILSKKSLSIIDRELQHKVKLPKLTHEEILTIAKMSKALEAFLYFPQEISWIFAKDKLYIVGTKPFTRLLATQKQAKKKIPTARGRGITAVIGTGVVTHIQSMEDLHKIKLYNVVVMPTIETKYLQQLKKVNGIIVEKQPFSNEIAMFFRQHGIPTIVNVKHAGKKFHNGYVVTIHGQKGEIYLGGLL